MTLKVLLRIFFVLFYGHSIFCAESYDPAIFEKIFEEQRQTFHHLEKTNPKALILFSGTPGMGKTTLAKIIETHFQALRISRDEVRNLLRKHNLSIKVVEEYVPWVIQKLSQISPNHFIILDCSIDRSYIQCAQLAKDNAYEMFLIRMLVNKDIVAERIKLRQREDGEALLRNLDKLWQDYHELGQNVQPDYIFDNNKDVNASISLLFEKINQKLDL